VPYIAHADAGYEVHVPLPIGAIHVYSLGPRYLYQEWGTAGLRHMSEKNLSIALHGAKIKKANCYCLTGCQRTFYFNNANISNIWLKKFVAKSTFEGFGAIVFTLFLRIVLGDNKKNKTHILAKYSISIKYALFLKN
jgi:hypothetical protein